MLLFQGGFFRRLMAPLAYVAGPTADVTGRQQDNAPLCPSAAAQRWRPFVVTSSRMRHGPAVGPAR
ncbi:hypothetical protein [Micromonospora deserti]|uniref:hypothetical protein n=1 Tax=Micromonospora deserti TaxID=2070366 RepID=UPI001F1B1BE8|nr:hypothetical protein [Micromonospora deserti]